MQRSDFIAGSAAVAVAPLSYGPGSLAALERSSGGRLGVFAIDTGSGDTIAYRSRERFIMCSTFKTLAVGAALSAAEHGELVMGRHLSYGSADILAYAPVAKEHLARGYMTLEECCAAAIEWSDNTAANLVVKSVGGPKAVTAYIRTLGDGVTRLDRYEPELNHTFPGDLRDTTSPAAMAADVQKLLLGNALAAKYRDKLTSWMRRSHTGTTLLRAGFPASWVIGDKSGMGGGINSYGDSDTRNDVVIAWPPGRAPAIVAAYLTGCTLPAAKRDAILASVARIVAHDLA